MPDFSVASLRVVREVVDRGSFTDAARRLGYTQSAVSRQVAVAEGVAGRPLFERGPRGVRPTDAGRLVARHAEVMLGEIEAVRTALTGIGRGMVGRLRVGGVSTAMAAVVPQAIAAFSAAEPGVRVSVREGSSEQLLRAVGARRAECVVVTGGDTRRGESLFEDPLLIAVPRRHRLAGTASVKPAELAGERWIAGSTDVSTSLLGAWATPGTASEIAYVARDWTAKLGLVAAGRGITVVPGMLVSALPTSVEVVRIDHPAATRTTWLVLRAEHGAAARFGEALRDTAATVAAETRRRLRD